MKVILILRFAFKIMLEVGNPPQYLSFFLMALGLILSTQIPSDRSQYDVYKALSKEWVEGVRWRSQS
jgi:hypothetical protein